MFPVVEIKEQRIETEHGKDVKHYNLSINKTLNTSYSNEAERISCLPRRWRCLPPWSISCPDHLRIIFWLLKEYIFTVIDKLFNREGRKVRKLLISYDYEESDAHQVDSWIRFALKHSFEELELRFSNGVQPSVEGFYTHYKLPHSLFRSKSLTNLTLSFCDLNLPSSMHFSSLNRLSLEFINISSDAITSLTSSCPLLEYLSLGGCNKVSNLDIVISNDNLKFVEIWDDITTSSDTKFMIDAPYLHSLGFRVCLPRANYCLKNLSNLAKATFIDINTEECLSKVYGEGDCNQWVRLLDDVHHVKDIRLCSFFVQVLSREVQKLHFVYNNATCIELEMNLTKWELPVISYLLKSSPKLKTLIIKPGEAAITLGHDGNFGFDTKDFWNNEDFDFSSQLQNLKTVEIYIYVDPYKVINNVDEVLKRIENCYVQFVRFLLKNATSLERMNIECGEKNSSSCNDYEKKIILLQIKLITMVSILTRASARCEVHMCEN